MPERPRYSDHLDALLALITYLALNRERARSPFGLARDLGLEEGDVAAALSRFPGIFRRSEHASAATGAGQQHSYTLHARYARRRDPNADDGAGEELDAEQLRALLDFVTAQALLENETRRHGRSQLWLVVGVFVAATASVVAAVIQATGKA